MPGSQIIWRRIRTHHPNVCEMDILINPSKTTESTQHPSFYPSAFLSNSKSWKLKHVVYTGNFFQSSQDSVLICNSLVHRTNLNRTLPEYLEEHLWLVNFAEVGVPWSFCIVFDTDIRASGRKLKCDGGRPSCGNCNRRGYPCVYVPV